MVIIGQNNSRLTSIDQKRHLPRTSAVNLGNPYQNPKLNSYMQNSNMTERPGDKEFISDQINPVCLWTRE